MRHSVISHHSLADLKWWYNVANLAHWLKKKKNVAVQQATQRRSKHGSWKTFLAIAVSNFYYPLISFGFLLILEVFMPLLVVTAEDRKLGRERN